MNLTLTQANMLVREAVMQALPYPIWVQAELSEARENGGHCYMDLIEKDEQRNTPVARAQARCWRNTWQQLRPHFERVTGQRLRAGMKVLLQVTPQFHEQYGFSWIVQDIDPTFTIGDMERRRQEIIRQLKVEGVFDLNKELPLPLFCQRIAVISSAGAAGYGDFCRQLNDNSYGFVFHTELFEAIMQGEQVEHSVISALNKIDERYADFDCVVIIRGGGATSDLSGFDTLELAENVANFPLPVITGIGHERDESILDMISHTRVKTPTAAAAFLIDNLCDVLQRIEHAQDYIINNVRLRMEKELQRLQRLPSRLTMAVQRRLNHEEQLLLRYLQTLPLLAERRLTREQHRLQMLEQRTVALDPKLLLKRGYTITLHEGKAITKAALLKPGDKIRTITADGEVMSEVN